MNLFFPLLFREIHPSNQRFLYLKKRYPTAEEDPKGEISKFFTDPVVMRLEKFMSTSEWKVISNSQLRFDLIIFLEN
jgi:hypothetical protein